MRTSIAWISESTQEKSRSTRKIKDFVLLIPLHQDTVTKTEVSFERTSSNY